MAKYRYYAELVFVASELVSDVSSPWTMVRQAHHKGQGATKAPIRRRSKVSSPKRGGLRWGFESVRVITRSGQDVFLRLMPPSGVAPDGTDKQQSFRGVNEVGIPLIVDAEIIHRDCHAPRHSSGLARTAIPAILRSPDSIGAAKNLK